MSKMSLLTLNVRVYYNSMPLVTCLLHGLHTSFTIHISTIISSMYIAYTLPISISRLFPQRRLQHNANCHVYSHTNTLPAVDAYNYRFILVRRLSVPFARL